MSDDKQQSKNPARKRVNPAEQPQVDDESLESVAGGCQVGCSNQNTCMDFMSGDKNTIIQLPTFD
jgi:hypothetical protein